MSSTIVAGHEQAVKRGRYVPAAPPDQAERMERQMGRNLYMRGRGLDACATDEMAAGWLAAERAGADAYWRCMMLEADTEEVY